ncbi:MAG: hypothetical protein ABI408_04775 [Gemmatimonadaceae bacterium]
MTTRTRKNPKVSSGGRKPVKVTRRFLEALTGTKEDTYYRVLDAIALKRRDPKISLTKAAKHSGTTVSTIEKYAGSALEVRSGRFDVRNSDRLPRALRMLTPSGEVVVRTTSSRTATRIAEYNNALREYVLTRDTTQLKRFVNKTVRSGGQTYTFVTDSKALDRNVRAGAVHFVDIYARGAEA